LLLCLGVAAFAWLDPGQAGDSLQQQTPAGIRLRRPIALGLADGGNRLLVANRDSGALAVVDTQKLQVLEETRFGWRLSDLTITGNSKALVTDEEAGEVVLLDHRQASLREVRRWKVGLTPVSVRVSDDGKLVAVACLWPRRLAIIDLVAPNSTPISLDL